MVTSMIFMVSRKCPPPLPRPYDALADIPGTRFLAQATGLFWCGRIATRFQTHNHLSRLLPMFPETSEVFPSPAIASGRQIPVFAYSYNLPLGFKIKIHRPVIDPVGPILLQYPDVSLQLQAQRSCGEESSYYIEFLDNYQPFLYGIRIIKHLGGIT